MILNEKLMIFMILNEKLLILHEFCAFRAVSTAPLARQQEQVIFMQKVKIFNENLMIFNDFQ